MSNPINRNSRGASTTVYNNPQFNTFLNRPDVQNLITSLQKQMPGSSPREIAFQLAKQKGVDINPLLTRFGLKQSHNTRYHSGTSAQCGQ